MDRTPETMQPQIDLQEKPTVPPREWTVPTGAPIEQDQVSNPATQESIVLGDIPDSLRALGFDGSETYETAMKKITQLEEQYANDQANLNEVARTKSEIQQQFGQRRPSNNTESAQTALQVEGQNTPEDDFSAFYERINAAVLKGDAVILGKLVRQYKNQMGPLTGLQEKFNIGNTLLDADAGKDTSSELALLIRKEIEKDTILSNTQAELLKPEATVEQIEQTILSFEEKNLDSSLTELNPNFASLEPALAKQQEEKFLAAKANIEKKKELRQMEVWQNVIDSFVTQQDLELLKQGAEALNTPTVQNLFASLEVPPDKLEKVQQMLFSASQREAELMEEDIKVENKLKRNRLILMGLLFVIDPHSREKLMRDLINKHLTIPMLTKMGMDEEQVNEILRIYHPASELIRLPFHQFNSVLPSLQDREIYAVMKALPKEERNELINEFKFKDKQLNSECRTKLESFRSHLSEEDRLILIGKDKLAS